MFLVHFSILCWGTNKIFAFKYGIDVGLAPNFTIPSNAPRSIRMIALIFIIALVILVTINLVKGVALL